jgi:microcystin degradation protein MlrC
MRIFFASFATETNTFSDIPTTLASFEEVGIQRGADAVGERSPLGAELKRLASADGHEVIGGLTAAAQPAAPMQAETYAALSGEICERLQAAGPVDIVILFLHGAMASQDNLDCEGDLLQRLRTIAGPQVVIGAVLDPHAHLTPKMIAHADYLIFVKEYPHTDVPDRLRDLYRLSVATRRGLVKPVKSVHDCRMISIWPTQLQPMRALVDRMVQLETLQDVLNVSFVHGFPWGDTPDTGAKVLVTTNGHAEVGRELARQLADEIWSIRDRTGMPTIPVARGIQMLLEAGEGPIVLADVADNCGGGAPGDSTYMLEAALKAGVRDTVFSSIYDPGAVAACHKVGVGGMLNLRIGGKVSRYSGQPVDLRVQVKGLARDVHTLFAGERWPVGDTAWIAAENLDIILNSARTQTFAPDMISHLGLDPTTRKGIVVKSTNHFYAAFSKIAKVIAHVATPGALTPDFANIPYSVFRKPYWPRVADPFKGEAKKRA